MTATPVFPQTPKCGIANFTSADAFPATKTVYAAGATLGSKVIGLSLTTNATESHLVTVSITRNSTAYALGSVTINLTSGYGRDGASASLDLIRGGTGNLMPQLPIDNDGQPFIFLSTTDTLQVTLASSLTNSKVVDVIAFGADF